MSMKVCKLVRLTKKDGEGNFAKGGEGQITVRNKAVVSEETIAEFEGNFKTSGLLYIVDKKATSVRDKQVEKEVLASRDGTPLPATATAAPTVSGDEGEDEDEDEDEEENQEEEKKSPIL